MSDIAITDLAHYRSFGTPGGEYAPRCRAAVVTEVGAWVDDQIDYTDPEHRTVAQHWEQDACALRVLNPTSDFLNVCRHDALPPRDKVVAGERTELRGGTWHSVSECPG